MEVGETGRKKISQNVGHHDLVGPKRNQHHYAKSIEENEKMVEEMQQQMLKIEKYLMEKTVYTCCEIVISNMHNIVDQIN